MSEVTQYEGILTYVDAAGNETEMYPEVKTDESLTVSGKAADAKAVGDKITEAMKNAGGKAINLTQEEYDALPEDKKKNGIYVTPGGAELTAKNLFYDGSVTGLGNNVQDAIDEQSKNLDIANEELTPGVVIIRQGKKRTLNIDQYILSTSGAGAFLTLNEMDHPLHNVTFPVSVEGKGIGFVIITTAGIATLYNETLAGYLDGTVRGTVEYLVNI